MDPATEGPDSEDEMEDQEWFMALRGEVRRGPRRRRSTFVSLLWGDAMGALTFGLAGRVDVDRVSRRESRRKGNHVAVESARGTE